MTIHIKYSCAECRLKSIPLEVPARTDMQDIRDWMEEVVASVGRDHQRRSPRCTATKISDLMIPMTGRDHIGGPQIQ